MPETNKMDPVVHALNFRSDQAQVLQLRAKIINSKALYDEFCKVRACRARVCGACLWFYFWQMARLSASIAAAVCC